MDLTFLDKGDRAEFDLILAGTAAAVPSVVLGRTEREVPATAPWQSSSLVVRGATWSCRVRIISRPVRSPTCASRGYL